MGFHVSLVEGRIWGSVWFFDCRAGHKKVILQPLHDPAAIAAMRSTSIITVIAVLAVWEMGSGAYVLSYKPLPLSIRSPRP